MTTKKTPVLLEKPTKKRAKPRKLRPSKTPDSRTKHGVWALHDLLQGELDQRLSIAKELARLEAEWVAYCGGLDALTPPMIRRIKWIAAATLVIEQGEKMSALGLFNLADHNFIALVNARERSMDKLEVLIEKKGDAVILRPKPVRWDDFFERPSRVPEDFLSDRQDSPPEDRDLF